MGDDLSNTFILRYTIPRSSKSSETVLAQSLGRVPPERDGIAYEDMLTFEDMSRDIELNIVVVGADFPLRGGNAVFHDVSPTMGL